MIAWLRRLFCRHAHTRRERRRLHGVAVMHFVCDRCGFARPSMDRTAKEHRQATRQGAVHTTRRQAAAKIIGIRRSR